MTDVLSIEGLFEFLFGGLEGGLFGSMGLMFLAIIIIVTILLFMMRASRFAVVGFLGVAVLGLTLGFGYTIAGWLGAGAVVVMFVLLAIGFIKIMS